MKILGLGDNVFDVYENMDLAYPGGNAVNVAVNAARLGADAAYLGNVGTDDKGEIMMGVLAREGVDTARCPRPESSTTKCCIEDVIDGERHWKRNDLGDRWAGPLELTPELIAYASTFDAVLTSCNAKMPQEVAKLAGISGIVVFDFGEKDKYRTPEYLAQVLPAVDVAQFSMSGMSREEVLAEIDRMGITCTVLATRGAASPLLCADGTVYEGLRSEGAASDTMGAGDAFITALVCDLISAGWRKGSALEPSMAEHALAAAAKHAQEACAQAGGFGHAYLIVDGVFQERND